MGKTNEKIGKAYNCNEQIYFGKDKILFREEKYFLLPYVMIEDI